MAFKILQNPFSAGALPRTQSPGHRWGSWRRSPRPLVGWGGDTPPIPHPTWHQPTFGARHASPRIPARSTPMPILPLFWVLLLLLLLHPHHHDDYHTRIYSASITVIGHRCNTNRESQTKKCFWVVFWRVPDQWRHASASTVSSAQTGRRTWTHAHLT